MKYKIWYVSLIYLFIHIDHTIAVTAPPKFGSSPANIFTELARLNKEIAQLSSANPDLQKITQNIVNLRKQLAQIQTGLARSLENYEIQALNHVLVLALYWNNKRQIENTKKRIAQAQKKMQQMIRLKTESLNNQIDQLQEQKNTVIAALPNNNPLKKALAKRADLLKKLHYFPTGQGAS